MGSVESAVEVGEDSRGSACEVHSGVATPAPSCSLEAAVTCEVGTVLRDRTVHTPVVLVEDLPSREPEISAGHEPCLVVDLELWVHLGVGNPMELAQHRFPRRLGPAVRKRKDLAQARRTPAVELRCALEHGRRGQPQVQRRIDCLERVQVVQVATQSEEYVGGRSHPQTPDHADPVDCFRLDDSQPGAPGCARAGRQLDDNGSRLESRRQPQAHEPGPRHVGEAAVFGEDRGPCPQGGQLDRWGDGGSMGTTRDPGPASTCSLAGPGVENLHGCRGSGKWNGHSTVITRTCGQTSRTAKILQMVDVRWPFRASTAEFLCLSPGRKCRGRQWQVTH